MNTAKTKFLSLKTQLIPLYTKNFCMVGMKSLDLPNKEFRDQLEE